jgi:hypothetical protein
MYKLLLCWGLLAIASNEAELGIFGGGLSVLFGFCGFWCVWLCFWGGVCEIIKNLSC